MVRLKKTLNFFRLLYALIKLYQNPNNVEPVFKIAGFRNHESFRLSLEKIKTDPAVVNLMEERYLGPPINIDGLMKLPQMSLGHCFAKFMTENKLQVNFAPKLDLDLDDEMTYLRKRARKTHDIWHVVTGYPPTPMGEIALSAFYLAQSRVPLSGIILGFGFIACTIKEPHRLEELMNALMDGWRRGLKAAPLFAEKWEEQWEVPLIEIQMKLGLRSAVFFPPYIIA
jgi:ubiquinone biosynthesis protein COQ4